MSGPDDQPIAHSNGGGRPQLEPEHVAATMMRQLTDLLAAWEHQALILAERGVDPRPLLAQLGRNLRAVADQLDGGPAGGANGATPEATGPEPE